MPYLQSQKMNYNENFSKMYKYFMNETYLFQNTMLKNLSYSQAYTIKINEKNIAQKKTKKKKNKHLLY